ncbi:MAG: proline dehydrogenase family protein [Actinomycetota bacterium]
MNGQILRAPVLRFAQNRWLRRLATESSPGRRVASRFVAGVSLDDAMAAARQLDRGGIATMFDHLGENVTAPEQAAAGAENYTRALDRIRTADGLDCAISIKLTQLGLDLSPNVCVEHVERVLEAAAGGGTIVMIDMESHAYVDRTLEIFRDLRTRHERVGVCLQTYLRRTAKDAAELPTGSMIRLVKGAYLEPPEVAFPKRDDVDASYARLTAELLSRGHTVHVATHDPRLVEGTKRHVRSHGVPWSHVEFQMLYGIRRDLQNQLAGDGYPVRVYVPYGVEWYPYLTRRLAERPANMWFFLSNLVRSGR